VFFSILLEDPYLGRTLGPYRLDELLGHGGMGRVYKATRQDYGGVVALKVLYERVPVEPILQSRAITAELQDTIALARRERFLLEEKTLAKLAHPAIARLMDAGAESDGTLYFVMEYVEGKTLLLHCQENALGLRQRLGLFRLVCDAVQHAHQQSVIHRDLKPSNILVTVAGQVKLLDFGISESLHIPNFEPRAHSSGYMTLAYA
jgi:serine/threonine-protein kinase